MTRMLVLALLLAAPAQEPVPVVIADGARQPHLAADKDGNFYCVFLRKGNVEFSTSTDGGRTWSEPAVALDAKGKARGGMQRGPRIGLDKNRNIVVTAALTFDEKQPAGPHPIPEIWLARSTDGGRTFSAPLRINEQAGTAPEGLHALAVAPNGDAHVAWLDGRGRKKGRQDLYYSKVTGGKAGTNVKVGATLCECCAPAIAVDAAGNPALAWRDGASPDNRPIWISVSTDGGRTFPAPAQVNQIDTLVAG